jgi:spermidine/putrescine transport system permease protein
MNRLLALYAAAVYAFLHVPLLVLAVFSFNQSRFTVWSGFSLDWYRGVLRDPVLGEAALNSMSIALVSTAIATVAGTGVAYAMWKRRSPLVAGAMYASLLTPEIVAGVSLLAFYQWIFRYVDLRLGMWTVILAHVAFSIAFVVIVVEARLKGFDPALEEAAMDLGATEWEAFRRVTLPSILPGVIAAALLAFTLSVDDYVITSFVAGVDSQTLPMAVYAMTRRGVDPTVNAISTMVITGLGLLILISERLQRT